MCSKTTVSRALDSTVTVINADEMKTFEASKVIRKNILKLNQWKFTGSFQDFQRAKKLQTFLKWTKLGPKLNLNLNSEQI